MPMRTVIVGSVVIIVMMWAVADVPAHRRGAAPAAGRIFFAAVFVVVFGFLFVTVAARISGLLGNSSNPVSGMTIATLMATCAMFLSRRLDRTALCRARADDWRGRLHCLGHCRSDFARLEDGLSGRRHSLPAQQWGLLVGVTFSTLRHWRHAQLDEYRPRKIRSHGNSL